MSETLALTIIAVLLVLVLIVGLLGSRLLLAWYLREVRGMKTARAPDEAIITYPMA